MNLYQVDIMLKYGPVSRQVVESNPQAAQSTAINDLGEVSGFHIMRVELIKENIRATEMQENHIVSRILELIRLAGPGSDVFARVSQIYQTTETSTSAQVESVPANELGRLRALRAAAIIATPTLQTVWDSFQEIAQDTLAEKHRFLKSNRITDLVNYSAKQQELSQIYQEVVEAAAAIKTVMDLVKPSEDNES